MQFLDDSLHPEHQDKVVITVAPYGPEWMPEDFPEDIPVTMEEQVQKAVDCYNAGATVLHLHVRELDGKGSKRLSKFNELIAGVRAAVPDMIIQVGGSISFAPEDEGQAAKWLSGYKMDLDQLYSLETAMFVDYDGQDYGPIVAKWIADNQDYVDSLTK